MDKCPKCGQYSVVYEEYFKSHRCLMTNCGWSNRFQPVKKFVELEKKIEKER